MRAGPARKHRFANFAPHLTDAPTKQTASVAFHGVRRADIRPGDVVVVQGGGPIGLLAAQCARVVGAGSVVVVEPSAHRRQMALLLGAHAVRSAPASQG